MKRGRVLSAIILTVLICCAQASAESAGGELLRLDVSEGWSAVNQTGPYYDITVLTTPASGEAPAVEAVLGYFNVYGITAKPVEDLVALSVRGLSWPGVEVTDLKDGKGFYYKARENGNPSGLLTRSAIYSESSRFIYLVVTVSAAPQPTDWSEQQRTQIMALWNSLTTDDPEIAGTVTAAKKYIPPEFFYK